MAVTPFLKLQKPPFDTIPWDEAINGNMDIIDAFIAKYMSVPNYAGAWTNATVYVAGQNVLDSLTGVIYLCQVSHTSSAAPISFASDRASFPANWLATSQSVSTVSPGDVGRNLFHNPLFQVQQRGVGPFTANGAYTADRWLQQRVTTTLSTTLFALSDADRIAIGDEAASAGLQIVCGGTAAAADFGLLTQRLSNVRRFGGKTTTISFWARATVGTPQLGLEGVQSFGTGGSPSATVTGINSSAITLSTTWTRYSVPMVWSSVAGQSLGTTIGTDFSAIDFWLSSGATFNARAGGIGVQSYTLQLWGMQLEVGNSATPLEKIDTPDDLARCQRFYQTGQFSFSAYGAAGGTLQFTYPFPVSMRAAPVIIPTFTTQANCSGGNIGLLGGIGCAPFATVTALGQTTMAGTFTASADL